jgi:hypothetical protein
MNNILEGFFMADKTNIEERIQKAVDLKTSLESKLEKVKGSPREEEFQIQVDKLNDLIAHLKAELEK